MIYFGTNLLAVTALVVGICAGWYSAQAHKGATGIVKERMDLMTKIGKSTRTVDLMMTGKSGYDAEKFIAAVRSIKSHSGDAMTRLFPKDSLQHPTLAKPSIWTDWDAFKAEADRLNVFAEALEWVASNSPQAVSAEGRGSAMGAGPPVEADGYPASKHVRHLPPHMIFGYIKKMCGSCHDKFRNRKP